MYGAQNKNSGKIKDRAMMYLRGKKLDASKGKQGWQAFNDFVVPLLVGAGSQARRLVQVASKSQHQWLALRISTCALTSGSSGSTNSPLRSAFVAH
jgi:hypothetical protein